MPHHHEFAIVGLGRFGSSVALGLVAAGHDVLGIDRDRALVQRMADELTRVVALDATDEEALAAVDITSFDTVVVAIGTDFESNLLATVALKSLGVRTVVCKAVNERQRTILLRVGADRVVLPEHDGGLRLARALVVPGVLDLLDLGPNHGVIEVQVPLRLVGQTLVASDLRRGFNLQVLAVKQHSGTIISPAAPFTLAAADTLVLLGALADIHRFNEVL